MKEIIQAINQCNNLFLNDVKDRGDNSLELIISEAKVSEPETELNISGVTIGGLRAIKTDKTCQTFIIKWTKYVTYSVVNEFYAQAGNDEIYEGNSFRIYSKSDFLEYSKKSTADRNDLGSVKHWQILTLNHIIDVISYVEPVVSLSPDVNCNVSDE